MLYTEWFYSMLYTEWLSAVCYTPSGYLQVCKPEGALGGPLDQEKGETQLSPLVLCGPQGLKFQLPVELRLPHTAGQGSDSWNFTLKSANHTSASSQLDSNWQSVSLDSRQQTSDFVPILVDHF